MTREQLIADLRRTRPELASYPDDSLLYVYGWELEKAGKLDEVPFLKTEMISRRAERDAGKRGLVATGWDAFQRGFARGAQGLNTLDGVDDTDAQDIAEWQQTVANNPISPEYKKFMQAKGLGDSVDAFLKAPVKIMTDVIAESLGQSLPSLAGGMAGGVAQGAVAGAGTPAEAVTIPIGAALGTAAGSGLSEYSSKILESMQEAGMDISDPESVKAFFADTALLEKAKEHAIRKAVPVAVFDGLSAGLAGRFLRVGGSTFGKKLLATAKEIGMQAATGMAGEGLGQVAAGENMDWKSVAMEGLAEIGSAPTEIATNLREHLVERTKAQKTAAPATPAAAPAQTFTRKAAFDSIPVEPLMPPANLPPVTPVADTQPAPAAPTVPAAKPAETSAEPSANFETQRRLIEIGYPAGDVAEYSQARAEELIAEYDEAQASLEEERQNAIIEEQAAAQTAQREAAMQAARERAALLRGTEPGDQIYFPGMTPTAAQRARDLRSSLAQPVEPAVAPVKDTPGQIKMRMQGDELRIPGQKKVATPAVETPAASTPVPAPTPAPASVPVIESKPTPPPSLKIEARNELANATKVHAVPTDDRIRGLRKIPAVTKGTVAGIFQMPDGSYVQAPLEYLSRYKELRVVAAPSRKTWMSRIAAELGVSVSAVDTQYLTPKGATMKTPNAAKAREMARQFGWSEEGTAKNPSIEEWSQQNGATLVGVAELSRAPWGGVAPVDTAEAQRLLAGAEVATPTTTEVKGKSALDNQIIDQTAERLKAAAPEVVNQAMAPATEANAEAADAALRGLVQHPNPQATPAELKAIIGKAQEKAASAAPVANVAPAVSVTPAPQPKVAPMQIPHTEVAQKIHDSIVGTMKKLDRSFDKSAWPATLQKALGSVKSFSVLFSANLKSDPKIQTLFDNLNPERAEATRSLIREKLIDTAAKAKAVIDREDAKYKRQSEAFAQRDQDAANEDEFFNRIEARREVRQPGTADGYRTTASRFMELLGLARQHGININLREAADALGVQSYSSKKRLVELTMSSVGYPTRNNLVSLMHEIVHDLVANLSDNMRRILHDAFERLPNGDLAFYQNPEADPRVNSGIDPRTGQPVPAAELTLERMVEHLTLQGVDREQSRSLIAEVLRLMKDYLMRGAIYLQSKLMGEGNVSPTLAKAWAENYVARFTADSYLAQFGRRPSQGNLQVFVNGTKTQAIARYNPATGKIEYNPTGDARLDIDTTFVKPEDTKDLRDLLGDDVVNHIEPTNHLAQHVTKAVNEAKVEVAAQRVLQSVWTKLFENLKAATPEYTDAQRKLLKAEGNPVPEGVASVTALIRKLRADNPFVIEKETTARMKAAFESAGIKADVDPLEGLTIDKLDATAQGLAEQKLTAAAGKLRDKSAAKLLDLDDEIGRLEAHVASDKDLLADVMKNPLDWFASQKAAERALREDLDTLKRDLKRSNKLSQALGETEATLAALTSETDRMKLADRFTDKLLDAVDVDKLPLREYLKALYELEESSGLELDAASPHAIRDAVFDAVRKNPVNPLARLVELSDTGKAKDKATATLVALLSFTRNHGALANIMRAQIFRTKEDLHDLSEAVRLYRETNEDTLARTREDLKAAKGRSPRVVTRLMNQRDRAIRRLTELADKRQERSLTQALHNAASDLAKRAESRLQAGFEFVVSNGAVGFNPPNPNAGDAEVLGSKFIVAVTGDKPTNRNEWLAVLGNLREWLNARADKPEQQGALYWSLRSQYDQMAAFILEDKLMAHRRGVFAGKLYGLAEMFERTGLRSGQLVASALNRIVASERRFASKDLVMGKKHDTLKDRFLKVSGMKSTTFKTLVETPTRSALEDLTGTFDTAIPEILGRLSKDPLTAQWFESTEAKKAYIEYVKHLKECIAYDNEKAVELGAARVKDDELVGINPFTGTQSPMVRRRLDRGVEGGTSTRHMAESLRQWLASTVDVLDPKTGSTLDLIRGEAATNPFWNAAAKYEANPETLRQQLNATLTDTTLTRFVDPLVTSERGFFGMPKRGDTEVFINPEKVTALWRASNGDLLAFLEAVYDRAGYQSDETKAEYIEAQLTKLKKTWTRLADYAGVSSDNIVLSLTGLAHYGIDARLTSDLPAAFFEFRSFSPEENRAATQQIALTAAFGRDAVQLARQFSNMEAEGRSRLIAENAPTDPMAWDDLRVRDPKRFQRLHAMREDARSAGEWAHEIQSVLETERGLLSNNRVVLEAFGGVLTGMLTGVRSAIKNLVGPTAWTTLTRSSSGETYRQVLSSYATTGRMFIGGLGQLLGLNPMANDERVQLMNKTGLLDPANQLDVGDYLSGERGVNNQNDLTGWAGKYVKTSRKLRRLMTQSVPSPLRSKDAALPAIRVNPFMTTQVLMNYSLTYDLIGVYDRLVRQVADFYLANPDRVGTQVTAQDLKVKDSLAFESLVSEAHHTGGFDLETLAAQLNKARAAGDNSLGYMPKSVAAGINNIVLERMTLEGSFNNTPVIASKSDTGRMAFTFIRWPIAQTANVLRMMEDPNRRQDVTTVLRGAKTFALGLLPLSVAFGVMLDNYDDWLGKKQAKRPISSGDPRAIWDNLMQAGTLGIIGDVIDAGSNQLNGASGSSPLSLDERIVAVNSAIDLVTSVRDLIAMGPENVNYANYGRKVLSALGGGGLMQNAVLADKLFGVSKLGGVLETEVSIASRTNLNNWLRIAGANIGMELRGMGGGGYTPSPMTPRITNMVLAALRDDREEFQQEFKKAVRLAQEMGKPDPVAYVRQQFAGRNPLRSLFRNTPTNMEVRQMLESLPDGGRQDVEAGLKLLNRYAMSLGATGFTGSSTYRPEQLARLRARVSEERSFF